MELDCQLTRMGDAEVFCAYCSATTEHKQYHNGRHRLYLCAACATLTTSNSRDRAAARAIKD